MECKEGKYWIKWLSRLKPEVQNGRRILSSILMDIPEELDMSKGIELTTGLIVLMCNIDYMKDREASLKVKVMAFSSN